MHNIIVMPRKGRKKAIQQPPLKPEVDENGASAGNSNLQFEDRQVAFSHQEGIDPSVKWISINSGIYSLDLRSNFERFGSPVDFFYYYISYIPTI